MQEREAKLAVPSSFEVPPADGLGDVATATAPEEIRQHATYYDTVDLRLARAGASLRFRSDDGWTVKLPESSSHHVMSRTEYSFEGRPEWPPSEALRLVRAFTRTEPVVEVARIATRRRRTRLLDTHGTDVAEIDDDHVIGRNVRTGAEIRFREIEVELAEGSRDELLRSIVRKLRKAGARPAHARSKVEHVLGDKARTLSELPQGRAVRSGARVDELVRDTLGHSVAQLVAMDPLLRVSDDEEVVHKARVATRRLRSDLRTLRPVINRRWSEPLRTELKWLGAALGRVRDFDVLLGELTTKAKLLPEADALQVRPTLQRLRAERFRARETLQRALDSDRYARLLDELVAAGTHRPVRSKPARKPARRWAPRLARIPRKRLHKTANGVREDAPDAELHEVRKRAKEARYAHEALAPILGKPARRAATCFEAVQEILGKHQDAVAAAAWLQHALRHADGRGEAFSTGETAGLFRADRLAARTEWPKAWKRAQSAKA